jgi:mRNA interferase MazF
MEKDFDRWNELKKGINDSKKPEDFNFHEREIWWCSVGVNIGFEQDGKHELFERPVLILRKFNKSIAWVVPLTSVAKENQYHYQLKTSGSFVILSQIRLISSKRFRRLIETINENEFKEIVIKIKDFLP